LVNDFHSRPVFLEQAVVESVVFLAQIITHHGQVFLMNDFAQAQTDDFLVEAKSVVVEEIRAFGAAPWGSVQHSTVKDLAGLLSLFT
jgi:hypothetical protein